MPSFISGFEILSFKNVIKDALTYLLRVFILLRNFKVNLSIILFISFNFTANILSVKFENVI